MYVLFSAIKYALKYGASIDFISFLLWSSSTGISFPFSSFCPYISTLSANPIPTRSYPMSYKYCAVPFTSSLLIVDSSIPIKYP